MSNRGVDGAADHRMLRVRDSRYGAIFERRSRYLGMEQVRTFGSAPISGTSSEIIAESILGGLHQVYRHAT